jgi:hypothetical protein
MTSLAEALEADDVTDVVFLFRKQIFCIHHAVQHIIDAIPIDARRIPIRHEPLPSRRLVFALPQLSLF